jgi:hypothetical protein
LNETLLERCATDLSRQLRGKSGTKRELLEEERSAMEDGFEMVASDRQTLLVR